jgi:hypothetical protein
MFNRGYPSLIAVTLMVMANTSLCRAKNALIFNNEAPLVEAASTQPAPAPVTHNQRPAQENTQPSSEEAANREAWRKSMAQHPLPKKGCFKASYPNREWKEVACQAPSKFPNPPQRGGGKGRGPNTVGNTSGDWSAQTAGVISSAEGSFNSVNVSGVDTNGYMLQLNTQFFPNSPACGGVSGCLAWQQFLYSPTQCGGACIFMEYWLIGYGATCPGAPWMSDGAGDCWFNSANTPVTAQSVADLTNVTLTATASAGGQDSVVLSTSGGTLSALAQDSVVSLANFWNTAEFNAFGDCCGSETIFNNPTTLVLKTSINDGTNNPPTCHNQSFTAETNNLDLGICCPYGGASPAIEFMEGNAGHTAVCGPTSLLGDPHITAADGAHYDFQGAGEFVSLRSPGGTEIQTRQTPVSTTFIGTDGYDGLTTCVSLNTAVAARVGKHRVTYEPNISGVPDPTGLQLRIDGVLAPIGPQARDLGNGGRVIKYAPGGELEVDFPDGKTLFVAPGYWNDQGKWYLNVDVSHLGLVSGAGGTSPRGIAGPLASESWLPALPNGASLGPMPSSLPDRYTTLYKKFADAWRVTNKDSLFDYAPGTSTDTFTMRQWPPQNPPCVVPETKPVEPGSKAVAEAACQRVMDPNRRANCVFDVIATGHTGFAKTYLVSQRMLADSTTISLTDDPEPSQFGEPVTFTAFVAANGTPAAAIPSGTVQFAVDGSNVGAPVTVDSRGRATWETSLLKVGTHRVTASYLPGAESRTLPGTSVEKLHTVKRCSCDADHERKEEREHK